MQMGFLGLQMLEVLSLMRLKLKLSDADNVKKTLCAQDSESDDSGIKLDQVLRMTFAR